MTWTLAAAAAASAAPRPHIVWIVADDLGYNDVPFTGTGSEISTPHLSSLASEGVVLGKYYVNAICTPTRASFMTGRYPIHLGLQHGVIRDGVPDAIPINETLISEVMLSAGYSTHMIGKWHLGFHQPRFTPERRGFNSVLGYYTGNEEYWNHTSPCWSCGNYTALDLHRANSTHFQPVIDQSGVYSTHLFANEAVNIIDGHAKARDPRPLFMYLPFEAVHGASSCYREGAPPDCSNPDGDELQAPEEFVKRQQAVGISDHRRATFAAMVGALDEAVGNISAALERTGFADNALMVFTTDNGAPSSHFDGHAMSNFPLRGGKGTLWEGGVRGAGLVHSKTLLPSALHGSRSMAMVHCTDWFPTFAALAGASLTPPQRQALDGHDAWPAISGHQHAARAEILHNIDPTNGELSLRMGDFKYTISGNANHGPDPRNFSGLPAGDCIYKDICPNGTKASDEVQLESMGEYFFNIAVDPQERTNLVSSTDPVVVAALQQVKARIEDFRRSMVPLRNPDADPSAQPEVVEGLEVCTPSPQGPILCQDVGVWRPWQSDPEYSKKQLLII